MVQDGAATLEMAWLKEHTPEIEGTTVGGVAHGNGEGDFPSCIEEAENWLTEHASEIEGMTVGRVAHGFGKDSPGCITDALFCLEDFGFEVNYPSPVEELMGAIQKAKQQASQLPA